MSEQASQALNEGLLDKEIDIEFSETQAEKLDQDQEYTIYNGVKIKENGEIDYPEDQE